MKDEKTPQEKQLGLMRLQTVMIGLILVLIALLVFFLMAKANQVMAVIQQLDMDQLNQALASLKSAADQLASVDVEALNNGIQGISDAAGQLGELDFEKLNSFMTSLEELGEQVDNLSGLLGGLFRK